MFIESVVTLLIFWVFNPGVRSVFSNMHEILEYNEPSSCALDEYFNVNQLKCVTCDSEKNLVPSHDGLSCACNERSRIIKWDFVTFPICEPCKENEIPTKDQLDCIPIPTGKKDNLTTAEEFQCPKNTILVDKTINGSLENVVKCVKCDPGMEPSLTKTTCVPCLRAIVTGIKRACNCREGEINISGTCSRRILIYSPYESDTYTITYENGMKVESQFFRDNLLKGVVYCKEGNQTACQLISNMCAMLMFNVSRKMNPCLLLSDKRTDIEPWLFYGEGEAPTVLSRKRIPVQYNLNFNSHMSHLNLTGVIYNPDGSFKEIKNIFGHHLQLCPGSWKFLNINFRFAAKYNHLCEVTAQQLLTLKETEFMDLYLRYRENNGELLYAIPILVLNIKSDGSYPNRQNDKMQWELVRRFFLIDKISGVQFDEDRNWRQEKIPKVVRYAKSITLNVRLQGRQEEGKIFVPYLVVEYGEITSEDIMKNKLVTLSFRVDYHMSNGLSHALEVCMGVFSGLAVVWSGIRTWSHSKRSGRPTIDFITVAQLILFTCGNLANVFFLIIFCASLNTFVFFKGQNFAHVLLPGQDQEDVIRLYIMFAFLLKIIEIVHLIYNQITIDIFFIDWERPRARNTIPRTPSSGYKNSDTTGEQPVSIWRTYFIANEWNEIQTKRKLNVNIHLLITVLFLKVFGLENWATSDPELNNKIPKDSFGQDFSFTCRLAVGCIVYLTIYLTQILFMMLIYERFIKNGIQEFVDVCSMANISVFVLALENYGFYIHGRSAHGFADTDMQSIINQLQREEEDLVGHRGLLPGTDQQTFEMTVPVQLRAYYTKVMSPLQSISKNIKRPTISTISGRPKLGPENVDRSVQAYHSMNRFLTAFLEHALKDLDYEVKEKLFTEALLGMEFSEANDKGVFYSDSGHSFDNVLFYGNEFTLLMFDILLFCFVIALVEDYLVAGIVTAAFSHILALIRNIGGEDGIESIMVE